MSNLEEYDLLKLTEIWRKTSGREFLTKHLPGRICVISEKTFVWDQVGSKTKNTAIGDICLITKYCPREQWGGLLRVGHLEVFYDDEKRNLDLDKVILICPNKNLNLLSFVFTGKMVHERGLITTVVTLKGGKSQDQVSKNTDYLVTNVNTQTTKYKKALKLNVPIINEKEFFRLARGM